MSSGGARKAIPNGTQILIRIPVQRRRAQSTEGDIVNGDFPYRQSRASINVVGNATTKWHPTLRTNHASYNHENTVALETTSHCRATYIYISTRVHFAHVNAVCRYFIIPAYQAQTRTTPPQTPRADRHPSLLRGATHHATPCTETVSTSAEFVSKIVLVATGSADRVFEGVDLVDCEE